MASRKKYAVITGDVIDSTRLNKAEKDQLAQLLKKAFAEIKAAGKNTDDLPAFSIFRGDSFQGVLSNPAKGLLAGLLIRASLRENQPNADDPPWDARLSIGIGAVDYLPKTVSEGDGEAFRSSGPVLDQLKKEHKLAITTPSESLNAEFKSSCALLDAVINKWTPPQAEIVHMLLQNKTPKIIARDLDISQAAVHYRVKNAGWFAIEAFLHRYKTVITSNKTL